MRAYAWISAALCALPALLLAGEAPRIAAEPAAANVVLVRMGDLDDDALEKTADFIGAELECTVSKMDLPPAEETNALALASELAGRLKPQDACLVALVADLPDGQPLLSVLPEKRVAVVSVSSLLRRVETDGALDRKLFQRGLDQDALRAAAKALGMADCALAPGCCLSTQEGDPALKSRNMCPPCTMKTIARLQETVSGASAAGSPLTDGKEESLQEK